MSINRGRHSHLSAECVCRPCLPFAENRTGWDSSQCYFNSVVITDLLFVNRVMNVLAGKFVGVFCPVYAFVLSGRIHVNVNLKNACVYVALVVNCN